VKAKSSWREKGRRRFLSKEATPQNSSQKVSKEFQFKNFKGASDLGASFQVAFPQLGRKKFSPQFEQHLKEMEAKIFQQAKEKILILEKEAYEKGFTQGEKDGLELGQKRIETMIGQLNNVLRDIERQRIDLYNKYIKEMVQLVLSIAKKVLHREVNIQEDTIAFTLQEAFKYVLDQRKVFVHLNPVDYQFLLSHRERSPFSGEEMRRIQLVEDPAISRGSSLLETSFGDIDATLENQFDQIASLIWQEIEHSNPSFPSPK
jgi:flagellar assembly protein FliH